MTETYERDGLRLSYEVSGDGPPILCVHGATGTAEYEWAAIAGILGARYRFVLPDLRGHGRSEYRAGEMSIEFVNDDLLALIQRTQLDRPHVLAFSFGAEAALDLALTHAGTTASLILVSPGLGDPEARAPTRAQLEAGWPRRLRQLHIEHHGEQHWLDVMLELCERAALRPKTDLEAFGALPCPILLIVGSGDDPRRVRDAHIMENAHDDCRLVVIDGARHAVHKERPEQVAAAIGAFLDDVGRRTSTRSAVAADTRTRRAQARSARFVAATVELMRERGGTDFTVQDVVDRSRMSIRTFYNLFAGKDDLLVAVCEAILADEFTDQLRARCHAEDDPIRRVRSYVEALHEMTSTLGPVSHVLMTYTNRLAETRPRDLERALKPQFDLVIELLREAAASGALRPGISLEATARVLHHAVIASVNAQALGGERGDGIAADQLWQFCASGIGAPTSSTSTH